MTFLRSLVGVLIVLGSVAQPAGADKCFYKGKRISIVVPTGGGTSTDAYSRLVARRIAKYIPGNPEIVVRSVTGDSGMRAANWLYKIARPDGLTIGTIYRTLLLEQVLGEAPAKFDPAKFNWIGTPVQETASCFVLSDSPYKTALDLVDAMPPVKMEATQPLDVSIAPQVLNKVIGTNIEVPRKSYGIDAFVAAQHQVDGICLDYAALPESKKDLLTRDAFRGLVQIGLKKHAKLEAVPLASEFAKADKKDVLDVYSRQLSVGLPWAMPPGVPSECVKTTRDAFRAVMSDDKFLAQAKEAGIDVNPLLGNEFEKVLQPLLNVPQKKLLLKTLFGRQ